MLRETIVQRSAQGISMDDHPEMQMDAITAMVGFFGFEGHAAMAGASDGPGGAFVGGMTSSIPDIDTYLAGMEARSGKPMSDKTRASLSRMAPMLEALRDPDAVAADPDAFIDRMAASTGKQPTDAERAQMKAYIGRMVAARQRQMGAAMPPDAVATDPAAAVAAAAPSVIAAASVPVAAMTSAAPAVPAVPTMAMPYLAAAQAATFHPPLGFGTFLETYAKREGWLASMSITRRLPWRALGLVEIVVGVAIAAVSGSEPSVGLGIGLGVAAGGVATWLIAPSMASKTMEGAMMKAQLAAYRRTLQATFTSAGVVDDSLKAKGMSWLETPDQVLVWGVALGLRDEIADLLRRSASTTASDASAGRGGAAAVVTDLGIFEGIERIGTVVPPQHHSS